MKLKRLAKYLAPVLLMGAYTASASADIYQCPEALFNYADKFPIEKLGAKVLFKKEVEPNPHGGPITITTYKSGDNWISTRACNTCNPREARNGIYINVNEPLPCGLKKGMTEQQITQIMGRPSYVLSNGSLSYPTSVEETNEVILYMENGRLQGLMNSYY